MNRTEKLIAGIEARKSARGFHMPEDLADALTLVEQLERENAQLREALEELQTAINTWHDSMADASGKLLEAIKKTALAKAGG